MSGVMTMLYSPKLAMWYVEAFAERGIVVRTTEDIDKRFAIYPRRFYGAVEEIGWRKFRDYTFIGAFRIDPKTEKRRAWIIPFARQNFGERSYLQFTDRATRRAHESLGSFDHTLRAEGFVPKELPLSERNKFDEHYFRVMCSSQFVLCPGGDENWSMRFYEALMCKAIPILSDRTAFRTAHEAQLPYKYFLVGEKITYREDWAEHNHEVFMQHHTLERLGRAAPVPPA
jgi:hypothetical protein